MTMITPIQPTDIITSGAPPSIGNYFMPPLLTPTRTQTMQALVDDLFAAHSPEVANLDGKPSPDPAIECQVLVGLKEFAGALSRHPKVPGVLRMLSPAKGADGRPLFVETLFHLDQLVTISVQRRDLQPERPSILTR